MQWQKMMALCALTIAGAAQAATWQGYKSGQLDNAANWDNPNDATLNFARSAGKPLYLNADMCANGFKYSSHGGTISNEFALGAGKTLWVTNSDNNACHLKGNDTFLTLSSGTLKLGNGTTSATVARVGDGAADRFTLLVTGADAAIDMGSAGVFSLGWGSANGLLALRDGASFTGKVNIGIPNSDSSGNTLLVADPGTTFTAPDYVYIGNQGNGNAVIVSNGASFVANAVKFTPANYGDPTGVGNVFRVEAGATAEVTGYLWMYYTSSNRVEVLNGGRLDVSDGLRIGYDGNNTRYATGNEVIVDGAGSTLNIKSSGLVLAHRVNNNLGGMQYARIRNGGAMTVAGESDDTRIGYLSPATLEVTDGGTFVTSNKYVWVGYDSVVGGSTIRVGKGALFAAASTDANAAINLGGQEGNPSRIVVDGGTLTANQISPCRYADTIVTNGGVITAAIYNSGSANDAAANMLTVAQGGTFNVIDKLHLGGAAGMATQPAVVKGGAIYCVGSLRDHAIGVGVQSPGTLDITDGGIVVTSNNYFCVGNAAGAGGSWCRVGPGGRLETRTNGGKDVRITVTGGNGQASSFIVDGGTVEADTHCCYLTDNADITVKNGGTATFQKFYSDEVGSAKHSTVHVDNGTLAFRLAMNVGFCDASSKGVVTIAGRNARLTVGNELRLKSDTTLSVTVPAEGFAQTPISAGKVEIVKVDGVDAPTLKIDASAYTKPARLVIAECTSDMTGLSDATIDLSGNAVLDTSNPRQIAVYVNVDVLCTGAGSEDWNDAANWQNIRTEEATVPTAGQGVIVAPNAAKTLVISAATPKFAGLEIGGNAAVTLVLTNWTTAVNADLVTIKSGSTVTCAGPFRDNEMSNRVWIVCKDFTLEQGAAIDVDNKGYAHGDVGTSGNAWAGYGPGGGFRSGATHGGYGGQCAVLYADGHALALPNDDAAEPELPGSGGARGNWSDKANHGGGAVRIDATGTVTLNGSILASAAGGFWDGTYTGFGAGGSILIHAATLVGAGVLKAEGGSTAAVPPIKTNAGSPFPGGGGRIALHYTAASAANLTVSVRQGLFNNGNYPMGSNDYNRVEADMGTLYFSDDSIWQAGFGKRITGLIVNPQATAYDFGDVDFTAGHVRFGADGLTFRMKSLAIRGNNARFELGGSTVEQVASYRECRSTEPNALVVSGDLAVSENGRLDIRAAFDGGTEGIGARVTVGGDLTVGAKGYVYAWSDVLTGARPQFVVSNDVTVAVGGVVSAEHRGYAGGHDASTDLVRQTAGHGAGAGRFFNGGGTYMQYAGGGGHGGRGSISAYVSADDAATSGKTYDSAKYPTLPGSGGGHYNSCMWGGAAGGGVLEMIAGGTMTVDGLLNADGEVAHGQRMGAGAGGSIALTATQFGGAGTLSAKGGPVDPIETSVEQMYRTGAGGGGRIAVIVGNTFADLSDKTTRAGACPATFTGATNVLGGTHPYDTYEKRLSDVGILQGASGTVRYLAIVNKPGFSLIVR